MTQSNPYSYLKIDDDFDASPLEVQNTWVVDNSSDDIVTLFTSEASDGSWVYGYHVTWKDGRVSHKVPTAALGRFRSEREAKLYAVGFMLSFKDYFCESTVSALRRGEAELQQAAFSF